MISPRRKRARKHIAIGERLACALSMLLPQQQRDELRAMRVPAKSVIKLFTPDHNELWALGGSDKWWNMTERRRGPELKAKDARDTSIVAKSKRVERKWRDFTARVLGPVKRPAPKRSRWPQGRRLQSRNSFEKRP